MIDSMRDVTLAAGDPEAAVSAYALLLGVAAERAPDRAPRFRLANMDLVVAPTADKAETSGLYGMAFAVKDLGAAERLLANRGIASTVQTEAEAVAFGNAGAESQPRHLIADDAAHGVRIALAATPPRDTARWAQPSLDSAGAIVGLDHLVLRTPAPERALAFYGAQLGLSLRFDQTYADWGSRIMLFRCGDLMVELVHSTKEAAPEGPDELWGFSWRTSDIEAARERLAQAGLDVSEVRAGRRPGSRIFTVRSGTLGVPTIVLGMDEA